jgi:hypothetical protein
LNRLALAEQHAPRDVGDGGRLDRPVEYVHFGTAGRPGPHAEFSPQVDHSQTRRFDGETLQLGRRFDGGLARFQPAAHRRHDIESRRPGERDPGAGGERQLDDARRRFEPPAVE